MGKNISLHPGTKRRAKTYFPIVPYLGRFNGCCVVVPDGLIFPLIFHISNTDLIIKEEVTTTFADSTLYYSKQTYGPYDQQCTYFLIPAEIGIKYPFAKYFSLTIGILRNFYLGNQPFYYDNEEYKGHVKLKVMVAEIFY